MASLPARSFWTRTALAAGVLLVSLPGQGPSWSSPTRRPNPRYSHASAFQPSTGRLLVFGGLDASGGYLGNTFEFDGAGWIEHVPAVSPPARAKAAMAYDPGTNRVLLHGGVGPNGALTDTWSWDGRTWSPVTTATTPNASVWSAMVHHGGAGAGVLLLTNDGANVMRTWRFASGNWSLILVGGLPTRVDAAMEFVPSTARTYVHGGIGRGDMYAFDGANWTVVGQSPATGPIGAHSIAWSPRTSVLLLVGGGDVSGYNTLTFRGTFLSPGQIQWTFTSNFDSGRNAFVPASREYASLAWDGERDRYLLFGGAGSFLNFDDLHQTGSGAWAEVLPSAAAPPPRVYGEMSFDDSTGDLVLFGGVDTTGVFGDTWTRDALGWSFRGNNLGASPRVWPAMAHRSGNGTIMFGGASANGSGFLDETLAWNGNSWVVVFSPSRPAMRYAHEMVRDSARNRIVLFGGYNGAFLGDTWEFGSSGWVQLQPSLAPPARGSFAMAFDRRRNRTVLFGGQSASGNLGDTWEFDGTTSTWTQRNPANAPSPRWSHSMAFDEARGVTVLTGGFVNGLHLNDVWEYDGENWRQRSAVGGGFAPREGAAMAYDPQLGHIVAHGGGGFGGSGFEYRLDTWLYRAPADTMAPGSANASSLRITDAATEGGPFRIESPAPSGLGWLLVGLGSDPLGQPFPAQLACSPSTIFGLGGSVLAMPGSPPSLTFVLPAQSGGLGLTFQGIELDVAQGCLRVTDPIAITVQAR
ncbi:MAG: kelch repeat-containing protein [Planctomycetota bacterium]